MTHNAVLACSLPSTFLKPLERPNPATRDTTRSFGGWAWGRSVNESKVSCDVFVRALVGRLSRGDRCEGDVWQTYVLGLPE